LGWLALFAVLGAFVTALAAAACGKWSEQEALRRADAAMAAQLEQIKRGEIHCLVQPEARFVDELLADKDCAANVFELYLGGDLSDERLGRLRELPRLKCVVFLFADNAEGLLERLQGMETIEVLEFNYSPLSPQGIELAKRFPNLMSLTLSIRREQIGDLDGLKNHSSLENLSLDRIGCDDRLLPILESLPHLRSVTIEDAAKGAKMFEESLRNALPHCECSVRLGK
jgi:hypothetical protein